MKLVSYWSDGALRSGIGLGDSVADTETVAELSGLDGAGGGLRSSRIVAGLGVERLNQLEAAAVALSDELRGRGRLRPLSEVRLGPPIPDPGKIICLGLNYHDHAAEGGVEPPDAPMFFAKWANSLIGPNDDIVPPPVATTVDYEAELAVVIGARGRDIDPSRAGEHIVGVMVFNDVSDRALQNANQLWTGGKAIDTFAPCGPAVVTIDALGDIQDLSVRTRVNGEVVQEGHTSEMIFKVAEVIGFLSRTMTMEPGDIIATGTPAGIGGARVPPIFLQDGDLVETEIDGIGTLRNRVVAAGRSRP